METPARWVCACLKPLWNRQHYPQKEERRNGFQEQLLVSAIRIPKLNPSPSQNYMSPIYFTKLSICPLTCLHHHSPCLRYHHLSPVSLQQFPTFILSFAAKSIVFIIAKGNVLKCKSKHVTTLIKSFNCFPFLLGMINKNAEFLCI